MISELPDSYRWSDGEEYAALYLRWGCVASVKAGLVEVRTRDGGRMTGRCGSIEQGKRHVERWVLAQLNPMRHRNREQRAPSRPREPTQADLACVELFRAKGAGTEPPGQLPPSDLPEGYESEVGDVDVPFARLIELTNR